MNDSIYNYSETGATISSLSEYDNVSTPEFAGFSFIPENSILHEEKVYTYQNGSNNGVFNAVTEEVTKVFGSIVQDVSKYNNTVFSNYPKGLLCFGTICFILFAVVGVIGNFISILALSKSTRLRNATTAFIVNLCVADFLFCSFSMPLSAVTFIQKGWLYSDLLCTVFPLVRYSNGAVSLFSVIAITVNRYIRIVHPRIYQKVYTKKNIAIMIGLMWLISVSMLLPPLLGWWGKLGYDPKVGTCTILRVNGKSPKMFLNITAFIVPSIVFVVCYLRIFFAVRKVSKKTQRTENRMNSGRISFTSRRGIISKKYRHSEMRVSFVQHRDKKELKVLRVMLVVFILFIVCYFPVSFVKVFHREYDLPILNVMGYFGVYFSSIINPVVYIAMSTEYRTAYKELFCRHSTK